MEEETLGERMKAAATEVDLGAYQIAKKMGVYAPSVYKWWSNEARPNRESLRRYAEVVGKPVELLDPDPLLQAREAAYREACEDLLDIVRALAAGEPLTTKAGQRSPAVAAFLAKRGPDLLVALNELAAGSWHSLPLERQRAAIDRLARQFIGCGASPFGGVLVMDRRHGEGRIRRSATQRGQARRGNAPDLLDAAPRRDPARDGRVSQLPRRRQPSLRESGSPVFG